MGFTGLGPPRLLKAVLLESNSVSALAIPKVTVLDTVGAVSLLAVTALTKRRWLYWVALISTTAGISGFDRLVDSSRLFNSVAVLTPRTKMSAASYRCWQGVLGPRKISNNILEVT